jgi:hypothetical protein
MAALYEEDVKAITRSGMWEQREGERESWEIERKAR